MNNPIFITQPEVSFWLRKASKGYHLICEINQDAREARFSTSIKIKKKTDWNAEKKVLKDSNLEAQRVKIAHDLNLIISNLILQNKPFGPDTIVKLYKNKGYIPTLTEVYEEYIKERVKPRYDRKKIRYSTLKRYDYKYTSLKEALAGLGENKKLVSEVNSAFAQRLEQELCKDKDSTSVAKHCQTIFNVMEFAATKEYISKNPLNSQTFVVKAEHKEKIVYLTEKELEAFEKSNFTDYGLNEARDIFLFMCHTGMGFSDTMAFEQSKDIFDDIGNVKRISGERVKTGSNFCVPLLKKAEAILDKYNGKMPYVRNDDLNERIRKITKHLDFSIHLTSHIGRKTFGYIMLNTHRISIEIVSKMLGHKTIDMTLKFYARHLDRTIIEATKHLVQ